MNSEHEHDRYPRLASVANLINQSPMAAVSGANFLSLIISVAASLALIYVLPKEDYGRLVYFYASSTLLRLLMNLGLGFSISRDIATAGPEEGRISLVVYSTALLRVSSMGGMIVMAALVNWLRPQPMIAFIALAGICASGGDFVHAVLAGRKVYWQMSLMAVIQPVSYAVLLIFLVATRTAQYKLVMIGYALSFVFMILLGATLIFREHMLRKPQLNDFNRTHLKTVLKFVVPSYLVTLMTQAWLTTAAGILGWLEHFQESADFGVVFNLVALPVAVVGPTLIAVYYPHASQLNQTGTAEQLRQHVSSTLRMVTSGYLWICISFFAFAETAVAIFGSLYEGSAEYLTVLAILPLLLAVFPILTLGLLAVGRPWTALSGLVIQVACLLGFLLVKGLAITPRMLSYSVVLSSVVGIAVQWAVFVSIFNAPKLIGGFLQPLMGGIIVAVVLRWITQSAGPANIPLQVVIGALFSAVYWAAVYFGRPAIWHRRKATIKV